MTIQKTNWRTIANIMSPTIHFLAGHSGLSSGFATFFAAYDTKSAVQKRAEKVRDMALEIRLSLSYGLTEIQDRTMPMIAIMIVALRR